MTDDIDILNDEEEFDLSSDVDLRKIQDLIRKAKKSLKECNVQRSEYLTGWQRTKADYINFKKDEEARIAIYKRHIEITFIQDLFSLADGFDEAIKYSSDSGLKKLHTVLANFFESKGLEEIHPPPDTVFDPALHESLSGEGQTIDVVYQKGYRLGDRVLRPARVKLK